jgi:hypothetical protein
VGQRRLRRDRVLGEAALQLKVVAVHLVAHSEAGDTRADRLDASGHIRAERPAGRRAEPAEPRIKRRAPQALPVREVD